MLSAVRAFFAARGYLEVETPVRVRAPAPEEHIDAITAGDGWWLRTSPELHMKRLVGAGAERIFQLGPCFRADEHGVRHRPEFTMLEWYRSPSDYVDLRTETSDLLRAVSKAARVRHGRHRERTVDFLAEPEVVTVADAFARWAGVCPQEALAGDRFDELLVTRIEPHLGVDRPTFLTDYPIELGALARAKPDAPRLAERWELYLAGLEIANAFGELTDVTEQRCRFAAANDLRRRTGREAYPLDHDFMATLEAGMPPTSGCALGIDRLVMVLAGKDDIADVSAFAEG